MPSEPGFATGTEKQVWKLLRDTLLPEAVLMDSGWRPEHVMLLTTGRRHPVQMERTGADDDQETYWRSYWENDDVFCGHVWGCKGLERRAVVLCVNESTVRNGHESG